MKNLGIAICFLVALIATALISAKLATKQTVEAIGPELQSSQVSLWIEHLNALEGIQSDLENGCNAVALEKVKNGVDEEMSLLSDVLKVSKDKDLIKYANELQPGIVGRAEHFRSRHGTSWDVPSCSKSSNNSFKPKPLRGSA